MASDFRFLCMYIPDTPVVVLVSVSWVVNILTWPSRSQSLPSPAFLNRALFQNSSGPASSDVAGYTTPLIRHGEKTGGEALEVIGRRRERRVVDELGKWFGTLVGNVGRAGLVIFSITEYALLFASFGRLKLVGIGTTPGITS